MPPTSAPHSPTQLQGITDLTLIAVIKPGLIPGIFDSRSYAWRLRRVLELLDAARRAGRESDQQPNPFIDNVGRLRGIHFFRFAILEGENRVLLNVTFDGGWEPYMRLIWGPLGTLLDLIFCHCEGYPLAAASSYDNYIAWVRANEKPSQFFYVDSGGSVADRSYLEGLEAQQRAAGHRPSADLRAAQLALAPQQPPQPTAQAVLSALRSLKALYGMVNFFGRPADASAGVPLDDGTVLLRFAQDYLSDLRGWFAQGLFDPGQQFDVQRARFENERLWLMRPRWSRPTKKDRPPLPLQDLQAGILHSPKAPAGRFARGAVVLARLKDAAAARAWLKSAASTTNGTAQAVFSDGKVTALLDDEVVCTLAITCAGLQALGVHAEQLAALPAEFLQGMEARAGILGDVRSNHPQHWQRPRAWQPGAQRAALSLPMVHLVLQLRTCETAEEAAGVVGADRSALLPRLAAWVGSRLPASIEVLAVEPGWGKPSAPNEASSRDHFNFVDGISQPALKPNPASLYWDDEVKTGEVLLGWVNDRGDGPLESPDNKPKPPGWLAGSTFLVLRKIRQHVARFDAIVEQAAQALVDTGAEATLPAARELARKKLMGRGSDGSPLVAQRGPGINDFDYRHDSDGAQCPFASHVRRANPREPGATGRPPRIVRRGMAYGPPPDKPNDMGRDADERGVLFMAYNASIAEQFEVIQRWMTGGNSSGVGSAQADPILGVPQMGQPSVFRAAHGDSVVRIELGDQPVTALQWGLYAFVPTLTLLRGFEELLAAPVPPPPPPPSSNDMPPDETAEERLRQDVKLAFEDEPGRIERWRRVRTEHGGVEKIGKSVMVGGFKEALQVLRDPGSSYSAAGYGRRMQATLGPSPFGQDDVGPDRGHERAFVGEVKRAVAAAVPEAQAYDLAYAWASKRLDAQLKGARALGLPGVPVDFVDLGTELIAELCRLWFGVVYDKTEAEPGGVEPKAQPVRCPGHLLTTARNIFAAYPNRVVGQLAGLQAPALKAAAASWVARADGAPAASAPVLKAVLEAVDHAASAQGISAEERAGTAANVMLGMPATLLGSWFKVLREWGGSQGALWQLQHALALPAGTAASHAHASVVLRAALIDTMAADPVADGIWRTVVQPGKLGSTQVETDDVVWLGLGAALADGPGDTQTAEDLLFGGAWDTGTERDTVHACPGRGMAVGVLLGGLAAWLMAGQWARTPSPTTLTLTPFP